jgi:hypothetical protein
MEGGIGIFLLLLIAIVVIGGGIALYITGGALWSKGSGDRESGQRPVHKEPKDPAQEHTHFVGTPEGDEAMRQRD